MGTGALIAAPTQCMQVPPPAVVVARASQTPRITPERAHSEFHTTTRVGPSEDQKSARDSTLREQVVPM